MPAFVCQENRPPVTLLEEGLFVIRDELDYPALYSAMVGLADVLVTGDKDFADVNVETPDIVTPAQYLECYTSPR